MRSWLRCRRAAGSCARRRGVARILVDQQRVTGVRLASGEEIRAGIVISGADPRHTLARPRRRAGTAAGVRLAHAIDPDARLRCQGARADRRHAWPARRHARRGADARSISSGRMTPPNTAKFREQPYLEVTAAGNVVSMHFQFAPYRLRHGDWTEARGTIESRAVETLAAHSRRFEIRCARYGRSRRSISSRPGA